MKRNVHMKLYFGLLFLFSLTLSTLSGQAQAVKESFSGAVADKQNHP